MKAIPFSPRRLCRNYFLCHSVQHTPDYIPAKRDEEPAPYLIRGNPVILLYLVPDFRRDDVWMSARVPFRVFAGMTILKLFSPIAAQSLAGGD
jgi:hypothetical protein